LILINNSGAENITVGLVVKFPDNSTVTECVQVPEYSDGMEIFEKSGINVNGSDNADWGFMLSCINNNCSPADWSWWWGFNLIKINETTWNSMPVGTGPGGALNDFCWNRNYSSYDGHYCAQEGDVLGFAASNAGNLENYNLTGICLKQDNESCTTNSECGSGKCFNGVCVSQAENITVGLVVKFPDNSTVTECVQVPEYSDGMEIFEKSGINVNGSDNADWGFMLNCINNNCSPADWSWWWGFNLIKINETNWNSMPVGMGPGGNLNDFCWNRNYSSYGGHYCAQEGDVLGFAASNAGNLDNYNLTGICNLSKVLKNDGENCSSNPECVSDKCMNEICVSPSKNITVGLVIKFPNSTTFTTWVRVQEYASGKEIFEKSGMQYNYTNYINLGFSLECINNICPPADWSWYWSFNLHKNHETEWHSMSIGMGPGGTANNFCWNGDYSTIAGHYCAGDGDVVGIGLGYGNVPDFYTLKEIYPDITIYFCDDDNDTYFDRNVCGTCDTVNCTPKGCRETEGNDCNDNNYLIHPAANETCNGRDDNCNNIIDEGGVCGCGCESITNSSVVFVCGNKVTESCKMTCDLNCSGDGFIAGADNITIDGANYNLTGHGSGEGIKIEAGGHNNLIIENFNSISHFSNGIITGMGTGGVLTNSIIRNNNVHSNDNVGIAIYDHSDNNQIINNNCHDNGRSGIDLYPSNNCVVNDNLCYNNGQSGINVLHSGNNAVKNNEVYGNGEYGILLLYTNSDNNEITSNEIYNNYYGIFLDGDTDNNKINSNTITNNNYGISIDYLKSVEFANNNKINSNTICNNGDGDINVVAGIGTFGDENTCDIAGGYNDTTANQTSCKYSCSGCVDADGDSYNTTFNGNCGIVDCNDNNSVINPGAAEICTNGVDDNCNTLVDCCDPGCACPQGEICNAADCICIPQAEPGTKPGHKSGHNSRGGCSDNDNDGYNGTAKCSTGTDCDDSNPGIYPGAKEISCNKIDEDCDGFDLCTGLTGENCTGSEECETGICSGGVCIECESDNDCNTGEYCLLGICEEKKKTGGNCSENYECNSDNCFNGRCIECKLNTDCNPGEYCGNGICKKLITLGDGCKRNEECLTGRCNDGKCACVQDSDCESKYCNDGVCEEKIVEETVILEGAKAPNAAADEKTDAADVQAKEPGFLLSPDAPVLLIILIIIFIILLMFFVKRKGKDEN